MKVLVFDTETNNLPERTSTNKNFPVNYTAKWPHIMQLSAILYDTDRHRLLDQLDYIIKIGSDVVISEESLHIHGITRDKSESCGIDIKTALNAFKNLFNKSDIIVGHNITFDISVISAECIRNNIVIDFTKKSKYCTMKNSVDICKIEVTSKTGRTYYKFPKLVELYKFLFNETPNNLHNSFVDILICLRCYCMLRHKFDVSNECRRIHLLIKNAC
jgi:DNA polymerase III epsilon subunit-like protein